MSSYSYSYRIFIKKKKHTHGLRSLAQIFCRRRRQLLQDLKVAEMITYDIVAKILSWLPVKSLTRFRCVSKLWYSLINDPYFQEEQCKIASTRHKYIICRHYFGNEIAMLDSSYDEKKKMKEMMMYSVDTTKRKKKIKDCSFKFEFPPEDGKSEYGETAYYAKTYTLSNSVNGLVCACGNKKGSCYLMNLSTREVEKLPEHCSEPILYNNMRTVVFTKFLGLGFDASTGEYKVIRLLLFRTAMTCYCFYYKILTIGSNQDWRYVGEIPCEIIIPTSLIFTNEKLHWLAANKRSFIEYYDESPEDEEFVSIFTIDMKDETHGTIATPAPFSISSIRKGTSKVTIQEDEEGHLVLLYILPHELRVWTMKDYTTHQWINTYTIDSDLFLQPKMLFFGLAYNMLLFCAESKSEEVLCAESKSEEGMVVCSFDLQTKTFQRQCRGIYSNMGSYFYSESLLSPRSLLCKDIISSSSSNKNKIEWPLFDFDIHW